METSSVKREATTNEAESHSCVAEPIGYIFLGGYKHILYACLGHKAGIHAVRYSGNGGISAEIKDFPKFVSKYCNGDSQMTLLMHVFDSRRTSFEHAIERLDWNMPANCRIEYTRKIGVLLLHSLRYALYACPCTEESVGCVAYIGSGLPVSVSHNRQFTELAGSNGKLSIPIKVIRKEKALFEKALSLAPTEFKVEFVEMA